MIERAKDWNEAEGKKTKGKGEKKKEMCVFHAPNKLCTQQVGPPCSR